MNRELKIFDNIFIFDYKVSQFFYEKLKGNITLVYILDSISYFIDIAFVVYILIFINFNYIFLFIFVTIITYVLKIIIKRKRPFYFFDESFSALVYKNHSFPSEHTAFATLSFLITLNPISILPAILRILTLKHWLSDVIFSILMSSFIYLFFNNFINFF